MINDNNGNMTIMIIIIIDTGLHSDMGGIGWLAKQPHLTWQPRRLQPSCWSSEKPCWVRTNGSIPIAGWFIALKIPSINGWFGSNPIFLGHLRKKKNAVVSTDLFVGEQTVKKMVPVPSLLPSPQERMSEPGKVPRKFGMHLLALFLVISHS